MIDLIFVALLQAAAGDPAQPAEQQQNAPPAATAQTTVQTPAEEQVICRREQITGTRLTQRVCMTAAERQRIEDETRDMLQRQQQMQTARGN